MKSGISARQGKHHVAQKFSTTSLPCRSLTFTLLPFMSLNGRLTERESADAPIPTNKTTARDRPAQYRIARKIPLRRKARYFRVVYLYYCLRPGRPLYILLIHWGGEMSHGSIRLVTVTSAALAM